MQKITILYDGDCLVCRHFQAFAQLRKKHHLTRIDISTHPECVSHYRRLGYNPDAGMIIDIDGIIYHGTKALTILDSLLVTHRWQRVLHMLTYPWIASFVYPLLLSIRRFLKKLRRLHSRDS